MWGDSSLTVRPAARADFPEIGRILWSAFGTKLRPFIGEDPEHNARLLADLFAFGGLSTESARVAGEDAGPALGVCLLRLPDVPYLSPVATMHVALRHLGLWRGLRGALGLFLLDEQACPNTCIVALLAVAPEVRGRGIGGALLDAAESEAKERGLGRITLDVIEGNPARNLYMRHGFRTVRRHRIPAFMARLLGFAEFTHMEKQLS